MLAVMTHHDTIAAIATAPGEAGIAIVRVSGPSAYAIADAIYRGRGDLPSQRKPFTFTHAQVCDADGNRIDDVIMLFMRAPQSYTGEDQIEIHGHGGAVSSQRILRRVLEAGARLAEPGEFTRRAFLSGRMDLTQAEAVLDLIKARSERAAKAAVEQLSGCISYSLTTIYDLSVGVAADLEATMDFPEDELPEAVLADILRRLGDVSVRLDALLATWNEGRLLRDGALVVIAGRPNVGKSTLMNLLLGHSRAIVSDTPGTTRDTIEETYVLDGVPLRLVDTAGLRDADNEIEREGIRRSHDHLGRADAVLYMIDAATGMNAEDRRFIEQLDRERALVIWNKMDLVKDRLEGQAPSCPCREIKVSLMNGDAVASIRRAMSDVIHTGYRQGAEQQAVISERHRAILLEFKRHLDQAVALTASRRDDQIPLACAHLRDGLEALGTATGRVYHEELLNAIFSRFCIGK